MADVRTIIDVDLNTSAATAKLKQLQRDINSFTLALNKGNILQTGTVKQLKEDVLDLANSSRFFTGEVVRLRTAASRLDSTLAKGQVTLGQFFSARFKKDSFAAAQVLQLANERVRSLQTQFVATSGAAGGFQEAVAIRPLAAFNKQVAVSTQQLAIQRAMFRQATTSVINFGKNVQWAGRQLMVGFTVPLTIFGAVAGKAFRDLEKEAINFKKVYGDVFTTEAETEKMLEEVKGLTKEFTKYGVAAQKTMQLAAVAAQAGQQGAELISATREAIRLSTLGDMEQEAAMRTTISLQSAFKLSSDELAESINYLNYVENSTVLSLEDLSAAIPRVAPVIVGLGGNVRDMSIFLAAMREGGVTASEAANGLKSSLGRLITPTAKATAMAESFGINLEKIVQTNRGDLLGTVMELANAMKTLGNIEKQQLLSTLFGKFQYARIGALFENITREGSQANRLIQNIEVSTQELAQTADKELSAIENSIGVKFTKAMEDLKIAIAPIGELFIKLSIPIVKFLSKIAEAFNNLPDFAKNFIAGGVAITGIFIPAIVMVFGLISNLIGQLLKMGGIFGMFVKGLATGGLKGALESVRQSFQYMSLAELDTAVASQQLASATNIVNQALLDQVLRSEGATAALVELGSMYDLVAAKARNFASAQGAALFVPGKGMGISQATKGVTKRNTGGTIPGFGQNKDTVPAVLTPGEFVVNRDATKENFHLLKAINNGDVQGFNGGGIPGAGPGLFMQRIQKTQQMRTQMAKQQAQASQLQDTHIYFSGKRRSIKYGNIDPRIGGSQVEDIKTLAKLGFPVEQLDDKYLRLPFNRDLVNGIKGVRAKQMLEELDPDVDILGPAFKRANVNQRQLVDNLIANIDERTTYKDFGPNAFGQIVSKSLGTTRVNGLPSQLRLGTLSSIKEKFPNEVALAMASPGKRIPVGNTGASLLYEDNKLFAITPDGVKLMSSGTRGHRMNRGGGVARSGRMFYGNVLYPLFKFGTTRLRPRGGVGPDAVDVLKSVRGKIVSQKVQREMAAERFAAGDARIAAAVESGRRSAEAQRLREEIFTKIGKQRRALDLYDRNKIQMTAVLSESLDAPVHNTTLRKLLESAMRDPDLSHAPFISMAQKLDDGSVVVFNVPRGTLGINREGNLSMMDRKAAMPGGPGIAVPKNQAIIGQIAGGTRTDLHGVNMDKKGKFAILAEVIEFMNKGGVAGVSSMQRFALGGSVFAEQLRRFAAMRKSGSTPEQIKSEYKKLAKQYHPDLNPNNSEYMKQITAAYDQLMPKRKIKLRNYFGGKIISLDEADRDFDNFKRNNLTGKFNLSENSIRTGMQNGETYVAYDDIRTGSFANNVRAGHYVITDKNGSLGYTVPGGMRYGISNPFDKGRKHNVFPLSEFIEGYNHGGMIPGLQYFQKGGIAQLVQNIARERLMMSGARSLKDLGSRTTRSDRQIFEKENFARWSRTKGAGQRGSGYADAVAAKYITQQELEAMSGRVVAHAVGGAFRRRMESLGLKSDQLGSYPTGTFGQIARALAAKGPFTPDGRSRKSFERQAKDLAQVLPSTGVSVPLKFNNQIKNGVGTVKALGALGPQHMVFLMASLLQRNVPPAVARAVLTWAAVGLKRNLRAYDGKINESIFYDELTKAENKALIRYEDDFIKLGIAANSGGMIPEYGTGGNVMKSFISGRVFDSARRNIVPGTGDKDTVAAKLTPGEFVVNKKSTKENLGLLKAINSGQMASMNVGGQMIPLQKFIKGYALGDIVSADQSDVKTRESLYYIEGRDGRRFGPMTYDQALRRQKQLTFASARKRLVPPPNRQLQAMGGMRGFGVSTALGMGGMGIMMVGQQMQAAAAQRNETSAMGGALANVGMGASLLSFLPMIPKIFSPIGLAVTGLVAALGVGVIALKAWRESVDQASRAAAKIGSNLGVTANSINKAAELLGLQTPAQRATAIAIGFSQEEQQKAQQEFANIFQSEEGQKFIEELKSATGAERFKKAGDYIAAAVATGMMEKDVAYRFAKSLSMILVDPTLAPKLSGVIATQETGSKAIISMMQKREKEITNTKAFRTVQQVQETEKQRMRPSLFFPDETVLKRGYLPIETGSKVLGSAIQIIQDAANAQALAREEYSKGTISLKEYRDVVDQSRTTQEKYGNVIQTILDRSVDPGATNQAVKSAIVDAGLATSQEFDATRSAIEKAFASGGAASQVENRNFNFGQDEAMRIMTEGYASGMGQQEILSIIGSLLSSRGIIASGYSRAQEEGLGVFESAQFGILSQNLINMQGLSAPEISKAGLTTQGIQDIAFKFVQEGGTSQEFQAFLESLPPDKRLEILIDFKESGKSPREYVTEFQTLQSLIGTEMAFKVKTKFETEGMSKEEIDSVVAGMKDLEKLPPFVEKEAFFKIVTEDGKKLLNEKQMEEKIKQYNKIIDDLSSGDKEVVRKAELALATFYNGNFSDIEAIKKDFENWESMTPDQKEEVILQRTQIKNEILATFGIDIDKKSLEEVRKVIKNIQTSYKSMAIKAEIKGSPDLVKFANERLAEANAIAAQLDVLSNLEPSAIGEGSQTEKAGGGTKPLLQQLKEDAKLAQNIYAGLANLIDEKGFKKFIAGPFAPEFLQYLRSQGEQGLKIIQGGLNKVREAYKLYQQQQSSDLRSGLLSAPQMIAAQINRQRQGTKYEESLRQRGFSGEQIETIRSTVSNEMLVDINSLRKKVKSGKATKEEIKELKDLQKALKQVEKQASKLSNISLFDQGIKDLTDSTEKLTRQGEIAEKFGFDEEMAEAAADLGINVNSTTKEVNKFKEAWNASKKAALIALGPEGIQKYIRDLQSELNDVNKEIAMLQIVEPLEKEMRGFEKQNEAISRRIELLERTKEPIQEEIDRINEIIDLRQRDIELLNRRIEPLEEEKERLEEIYQSQIEALDKVSQKEDLLFRKRQGQMNVAQALSRGDVAGAAQAALAARQDMASARRDQTRQDLETRHKENIKTIDNQINEIRKQTEAIEKQIRDYQDQTYDLSLQLKPIDEEIKNLKLEQRNLQDQIYNLQLRINYETERLNEQFDNSANKLQNLIRLAEELRKKLFEASQIKFNNMGGSAPAASSNQEYMYTDLGRGGVTQQGIDMVREYGDPSNRYPDELIANYIISDPHKDSLEEYARAFGYGYGGKIKKMAYGGRISYRGSRELPPGMALGGKIKKYGYGSFVPGMGNTDRVPALLTPGEYVVNKASSKQFLPLLQSMNESKFPSFLNPSNVMFDIPASNIGELKSNNNASKTVIAPSNYTYDLTVNVPNANASADQIANVVIGKIKMMENKNVRSVRI